MPRYQSPTNPLQDFFLGADDPLEAADLRHSRNMENRERMIHDPNNKSWQLANDFINQDEAADPYSDLNSGKRQVAEQSALDEAHRFFMPESVHMRDAQATERGTAAQRVSYGTDEGKYDAAVEDNGQMALDAASERRVRENAARVKPTLTAAQQAMAGAVNWPPDSPRGRTPGAASQPQHPQGWQGPEQSIPAPQASLSDPALPHGPDQFDSPDVQAMLDYNHVDDGGKAIIRSMLNYDYPIPTGMPAGRSEELRKYLKIAQMIDPNVNAGTYESGSALRKNLTTGPLADRIRSIQSLAGHVGDLDDKRKKLNNSNFASGAINPFMNFMYKNGMGWDEPQNFDQNIGLVNSETGKVLAGGNATNELRESLGADIDSNSSDEQQAGFIKTRKGLIGPQEESIRAQLRPFPRLLKMYEDEILSERTKQMIREGHDDPGPAAPAQGTRRSGSR